MMNRIANYHGHLYLCKHATGDFEDYIQKAIKENLKIIGFSDHVPYNDELSTLLNSRRMSEDEFYQIYLPSIEEMKNKYKDQITVLGAFEIEYYPELRTELLRLSSYVDYCILGQHEICFNGQYKSVYDKNFNDDDIKLYGEMVVEALQTKVFKILAHPDIYMFNHPEFNEIAKETALKIIKACDELGVYMEINANGIRRCIMKDQDYQDESMYKYPNPKFWDIVSTYQKNHPTLKIIINDDCHRVEFLNDCCTEQAYTFARKHGLIVDQEISF